MTKRFAYRQRQKKKTKNSHSSQTNTILDNHHRPALGDISNIFNNRHHPALGDIRKLQDGRTNCKNVNSQNHNNNESLIAQERLYRELRRDTRVENLKVDVFVVGSAW